MTDIREIRMDDIHEIPAARDGRLAALPLLIQYWQVVVRWRWVIAGIIVGALALGLVVTLLTRAQYTATARIEISREQKNITNVEGLEPTNAGQDLEFYQTQYNLLQARSLAERVMRKLRLDQDDRLFDAHGIDVGTGLFGGDSSTVTSASERQKRQDKAVELLLRNVEISPLRGSALVDISYTSASPQLSAQIANEWTQQYIQLSLDRKFASTADARTFLEGRLADLRTRLEQSERNVVNYASKKDIVPLSHTQNGATNEATLVASDLEALNTELVQATADRLAAEARLRAGSNRNTSDDPLVTNATTAQLRQKRAEIAADYAKLLVQFDPAYPAARALSQQLKDLDASIAREESRLTNRETGVRSADYNATVNRELNLRARVEALKDRLDLQQRESIHYNIFKRDADTNRQLYDALLQRYKEIGVAGVGANNIAIVDAAKIPARPSKPSLPINMVLALLAGVITAAVAIVLLDQIDESLRDPSQVNQLLHLPLLGTVPDVEEGDAIDQLADAKSDVSEAYLSVRSNLAFSTDHGVPRALMVTSSRAAEGKSTTSFALATTLMRTRKRVLLVDADMRSPSIHKFAGVENRQGLSNYLSGEEDWQNLLVSGSEGAPTIMPAGPTPPSAAELLSSDRLSQLLHQLLQRFDHIVIDSPPVLGLADAPLLSSAVEGCVFVAEAEGVSVRGIKTAIGRLGAVRAHIFGVVLTKTRVRAGGYGYGYDYGYAYGRAADASAA